MSIELGDSRILSRDACEDIVTRIRAKADGRSRLKIIIASWWSAELRWARNRITVAADRRNVSVSFDGVTTNQLDDVSFENMFRWVDRRVREQRISNSIAGNLLPSPDLPETTTLIWSDTTANADAESLGEIERTLTDDAEAQGMLAAGYMETHAASRAVYMDPWYGDRDREEGALNVGDTQLQYQRLTQAQCSMTVRHPQGGGSGWAGNSAFDYARIESGALAKRALDKCLHSLNPVRIEPGRYTVILEPQACAEFVRVLVSEGLRDRSLSERNENQSNHPFWLGRDDALQIGRSKLGLQVIDERLSITHDPSDPETGIVMESGMRSAVWIDHGVLRAIGEPNHQAARQQRRTLMGNLRRDAFRVSGGSTSLDEMISTTQRGLLVTRLHGILVLDRRSVLCTGVTRDGLWLIENGKISKSVMNMRFTESPLFSLNQVDQIGPAVPVFSPMNYPEVFALIPTIVPSLKLNDFSFTSLVDAV